MYSPTTEQRQILSSIWDIASGFEDDAFTWEGEMPEPNIELLADRGFWGMNIAEAYGGGGLPEILSIFATEIIGRTCPDTAHQFVSQAFTAPRAIEMFGSEELKQRYLPAVAAAETYIAIGMSEPEAGSDLWNMNTTVSETETGELVLNGEKIWVTDFNEADAAVIWTKFPEEGIGSVLIDLDQPGVEVNTHFTNMAGNTQTHFFIEEVPVPAEHVLVRGRDQFKTQLKALNWERCGIAALTNAMSLCAFDHARTYAREREQFDQPIADFQGIQWKFAEMAKRIEAGRTLTHRAASNAAESGGAPDPLEVSIAKLYGAQSGEDIVSEALQIHGATGYQQRHPLEYLYRLARSKRISGGTDEIMLNTIGKAVLNGGIPALTDRL
jgi:alkylation response protein AidB-like acyl-CoA dehydrogenase